MLRSKKSKSYTNLEKAYKKGVPFGTPLKAILEVIWLEDSVSIEKKLALMQEYKLAGAAFWNSDLDNSSIWDTIIKYIN